MRHCEEFATLLDGFADGELDAAEALAVQAHLEECPACRAYVDDVLAIRAACSDLDDIPVPDGFSERVMASIRAADAVQTKKKAHWFRALPLLAACCGIVVLLGGVLSADKGNLATGADTAAIADAAVEAEEGAPETETTSLPQDGNGKAAIWDFSQDAPAAQNVAEPEAGSGIEQRTTTASGESFYTESAIVSPWLYSSDDLYTQIFLGPECADYLSAYTPMEETEEAVYYQLTWEEYEALQAQLDSLPYSPMTADDSDSQMTDVVWVVLSK